MAIEVMRLQVRDAYEWETKGVALVCTTSGRVLNLPVTTFHDEEQAEDFLQWCMSAAGDPRKMSAQELEIAVATWREWRFEEDRRDSPPPVKREAL